MRRVIVLHDLVAPNVALVTKSLCQIVYDAIKKASECPGRIKTSFKMKEMSLWVLPYSYSLGENVASISIFVHPPNYSTRMVITEEDYRQAVRDNILAALQVILNEIPEGKERPSVECAVIPESTSGFFIDHGDAQLW